MFLLGLLLLTKNSEAAEISEKVKTIIKSRVDFGFSKSIVVGYVENNESTFFAYGSDGLSEHKIPTKHTLFEIGSITKVFTTLLLSDSAVKKQLKLDSPVTSFFSISEVSPELSKITLTMLASHYSGLARMPANFEPQYYQLAPMGYTKAAFYQYLKAPTFFSQTAAQYHYSNFGFGLLGHIMERRLDKPFAVLLDEKIAKPLGMNKTTAVIENIDDSLMAQGHHGNIKTPLSPNGMLDAAGGIVSNANDLVIFLQAYLLPKKTQLNQAMKSALVVQGKAWEGTDIALGWHVNSLTNGQVLHWHNGSTGGFHGFVGMDINAGKAVVVLANSAGDGNDDIGMHLLSPTQPLKLTPDYKEISVKRTILRQYVGVYDTEFAVPIEVSLQGNQLKAKFAEQFALNIYPYTKNQFFYRAINAQIIFETKPDNTLMLYLVQDGEKYPAIKRMP